MPISLRVPTPHQLDPRRVPVTVQGNAFLTAIGRCARERTLPTTTYHIPSSLIHLAHLLCPLITAHLHPIHEPRVQATPVHSRPIARRKGLVCVCVCVCVRYVKQREGEKNKKTNGRVRRVSQCGNKAKKARLSPKKTPPAPLARPPPCNLFLSPI
jgi:hypothetical protein